MRQSDPLLASIPPASGLAKLFEQNRAQVRRFVLARLRNEADVDDVLQDLWIKLRDAKTGPIENGAAYLFRMANNLLIDRAREAMRRQRREQSWSDETLGRFEGTRDVADQALAADEAIASRQESDRVSAAIRQLPPGAQTVLRLHKIEGLSHAEIAAQLGISRNGVEKHMGVAMKHLRRALKDCG
jgi:RNA polymerase sigma factor (sigma-70 family)